jgi:hypothetical protein
MLNRLEPEEESCYQKYQRKFRHGPIIPFLSLEKTLHNRVSEKEKRRHSGLWCDGNAQPASLLGWLAPSTLPRHFHRLAALTVSLSMMLSVWNLVRTASPQWLVRHRDLPKLDSSR